MSAGGHNFQDLTGRRFGRLVVLSRGPTVNNTVVTWLCQCDCGIEKTVRGLKLKSGNTSSCGCARKELISKKNTTHGRARTQGSYQSWQGMLTRCRNKNQESYKNYGGRGITVCEEWASFENFLADMGERPAGMTLERCDNNQGYNKLNCKWATRREQGSNKRNNHRIEINGVILTLTQWCEKLGINKSLFRQRVKRGWPEVEALTTPAYGDVSWQT